MIYTIEKLITDNNDIFPGRRFSLDSAIEGSAAHYENILCDTDYDNELIYRQIMKAIPKIIEKNLNEKEKIIIRLYFFERKNSGYIAKKLDCTPQNISRIKQNALEKIKNYLSPFVPDDWEIE